MMTSTSKPIVVRPIENDDDLDAAVDRLQELLTIGILDGSQEEKEYYIVQTLADAYQQKHHPLPPPHPLEAIKFYLEQSGMEQADLSKILGGRSRKAEILNGTRKLSINMMRTLMDKLHIPAEILLQPY